MSVTVAAVVVAAGRGSRVGGDTPKQYRTLGGEPVVRTSLAVFARHPAIAAVQPVIHRDDMVLFADAARGLDLLPPAFGAATRQGSVRAGLEALPSPPDVVLIHDAARPLASPALVSRAIAAAVASGAAIPAVPLADTVKSVSRSGRVLETLDRTGLRLIQTPQAFGFPAILDAHRRAAVAGLFDFPDDSALAEWAGMTVSAFEGEAGNIKLTTEEDFARAEAQHGGSRLGDVRTGNGFDVHAFGEGDHVMLGGVRIPHTRGLVGHSDADAALHALTDAVLGALAEGDIGVHFPPGDERWRGASSDQFLAFAAERVCARGGRIAHLDVTIVCEAPRVAPHRDAMRARIAEIAGVPASRVAVKATTSEKLGFTGRGEGAAAFATATIRLPWSDS
jgi:2-C-methyl-D-erythritol 4-phosphate cytidylyltransferase / 2-C-methyl-D-erythritol 2,4-cyclodiphosphate synthase